MHNLCDISNPYETGGIIIGRYSDDGLTALITEITDAPDDSIYDLTSFIRGINGLQKKLDTLWRDRLYYLGEWHYHPNVSARPSITDIRQMITISKNSCLKCPEPILIIIGGNSYDWKCSVNLIIKDKYIEMKPNTNSLST